MSIIETTIYELPTARLRTRLDCRALNESNVKTLMEKMRKDGFWKSSPLRVRPIKIREGYNGNIDGWEITSGRHRFEAAYTGKIETMRYRMTGRGYAEFWENTQ